MPVYGGTWGERRQVKKLMREHNRLAVEMPQAWKVIQECEACYQRIEAAGYFDREKGSSRFTIDPKDVCAEHTGLMASINEMESVFAELDLVRMRVDPDYPG
jgi:hypothetical protein